MSKARILDKPILLDAFCGAGGCTKGYQEAGFRVIGIDHKPQPNYCGDDFFQGEALQMVRSIMSGLNGVVAISASPPCQAFTAYRRTGNVGSYPNLIPHLRTFLRKTGLPYVIENVEGAPLEAPTQICGSGLGMDIRRHRLFETSFPLMGVPCAHGQQAPDRFPGGRSKQRTGSSRGLVRATIEIGSWDIPLDVQQEAMGIDWMTLEELSEAVPPAYTEHIGAALLSHLQSQTKAAA